MQGLWVRPTDEGYGPWEIAGDIIYMPSGETIVNPNEEALRAANFLPGIDEPPETDEQHIAVALEWEKRGDAYYRVYEIRIKPPPPPRKWSSLAIKRALQEESKWTEIKQMLVSADKYDDFIMADYIAEDDEDFLNARALAVQLYGEEAVAELLDSIPTES